MHVNVSSSGNKVLGMIRRTFVYKTKEVIVQLYKSITCMATSGVLCAGVEATLEGHQIAREGTGQSVENDL